MKQSFPRLNVKLLSSDSLLSDSLLSESLLCDENLTDTCVRPSSPRLFSQRWTGFVVALAFALLAWVLPTTAQAAECTSLASGNWSVTGNWSCGVAPTVADTVIINGHDMVLDTGNLTLSSLTMNGGTLDTGANALTLLNIVATNSYTNTAIISGSVVSGGAFTIIVNDGVADPDFTISATISDDGNGFGFVKGGVGTLALNGNNSYTGSTLILGGILLVNGNNSSSQISFLPGVDSLLGGTGTTGDVVAISDGSVAPGEGIGQLTTGNLSLTSAMFVGTSYLSVELAGTTAGESYDQVNVIGTVSLGNIPLVITLDNFTPAIGDTFVIVNNDSNDAVIGTFGVMSFPTSISLPEGSVVPSGSSFFRISYVGGDGNDVTLTVVEPEIVLSGNELEIVNGDNTPDASDGTDFGNVELGERITHTFVISNIGEAPLYINGLPMVSITGTASSQFTLTQPLVLPSFLPTFLPPNIAVNAGVAFQVSFVPTLYGSSSITLTISNADTDENPYTFRVKGNGGTPKAVSVNKDGTGNGTVMSDPAGIDCGVTCSTMVNPAEVLTLTATPDANSDFVGWSGDCSGANCVLTVDAAKNVTATFAIKHTLDVDKDGTGSGTVSSTPAAIDCGATCEYLFSHGTVVTLVAAADASSNFVGWDGACGGIDSCEVTMDDAKNVIAIFTLKQYTLGVDKDGTGSGTVSSTPAAIDCGATCEDLFDHGTVVTLVATADASSNFAGWDGECDGTGNCVVTMDAAKSVVATFTLKSYDLTVSKDGTGNGTVSSTPGAIDCGATCVEPFDHGTVVTLVATADASSDFAGWDGDVECGGTGNCVVTVDAAKNVIATFTLKQHPVTLSFEGTGTGIVVSTPAGINCSDDCTVSFVHGTALTLDTVADNDSTFVGWGEACSGTGSCAVNVTGPVTVIVTYGEALPDSGLNMDGEAEAGSPITFTVELPMNSMENCEWDFGDGSQESCAPVNVMGTMAVQNISVSTSHIYAEDGVYPVTVTASNAAGTVTRTLAVTIATPTSETPVVQPQGHGLFMPMLSGDK